MVLVALCLVTVLGVAVIAYVAVCARSMELSDRSFCTTSTVQLAEIGLEEALWSLYQASPNPASYNWSTAGWTQTGNTVSKSLNGFFTDISIPGTVTIQITNCNYDGVTNTTLPVITSSGISQMPDSIPIQKELQVTVKPGALLSNAVGSTAPANSSNPPNYVSFNNGGSVDSYNSSDGSGNYVAYTPSPLTTNRSDKAIICGPYISIGDALILGYAATANTGLATTPWNFYPPSISEYGSVTSIDSTTGLPSSLRIDNSRITNNANQFAFAIVAPTGAGTTATDANDLITQTNGGQLGTSGATTPSIYYVTGDLVLSNTDNLTINGPVIIAVSGNLNIQDSAQIVVTKGSSSNLDGSAQIYVAGQTISIGGQGINNQTGRPRKLTIFHDRTPPASQGQATINAASDFCGAVYTPNSTLTVTSTLNVYGSLVGQTVTFSGTPTIHYDLDLWNASFSVVSTPYYVSQWLVSN